MTPYYEDDDVVIYHADCREVLPWVGEVAAVVTSPPYNLGVQARDNKIIRRFDHRYHKYSAYRDSCSEAELDDLLLPVLAECLSAADLVFWNTAMTVGSKRTTAKLIGAFAESLKEIVVWDKGAATPSSVPGVLSLQAELVLVFSERDGLRRSFPAASFHGTRGNVWAIPPSKSREHGATFPPALASRCLDLAPQGVVLDPFMGTGSTLVAAKRRGRKAVGVEMDEKYCALAVDRLNGWETRVEVGA